MQSFADILSRLMSEHGFTQEILAEKSGISRPSISHWLCGRSTPRPDKIQKIAAALNVNISTFGLKVEDLPSTPFSIKLMELLSKKGMTQSDLAKMLGISNAAVSKWFAKGGMPRKSMLSKLAKALGVSMEKLCEPKLSDASDIQALRARSDLVVKNIELQNQLKLLVKKLKSQDAEIAILHSRLEEYETLENSSRSTDRSFMPHSLKHSNKQ